MADIQRIFDDIDFKIYECKAGNRYFDQVRKIFLHNNTGGNCSAKDGCIFKKESGCST